MNTQVVFTITEEHLKLLRRMNVGWQDCETGAPEIDPKRPYGNSNVPNDIHKILTGEDIGSVGDKRDELTDEEERRYMVLHFQMASVLAIVLVAGTFEAGTYQRSAAHTADWRKVPKGADCE